MLYFYSQSQLRNRLATELHKTLSGSGSVGSSSPTNSPHKSMKTQVADSIVADYLKATGYEYSLSIFLPEASTSMDKVTIYQCSIQIQFFCCLCSSSLTVTFSSS